MKNTGFIYEPLKPEDWTFGSSGLGEKARRPDTNWTAYLPTSEKQKRGDTDKKWCVTASALNVIETELFYAIKEKIIPAKDLEWLEKNGYLDEYGKPDFSDRYTAIASGTTGHGNSARKVAYAIGTRKNKSKEYGLIPEKMLPYRKAMSWKECYGYSEYDRPNTRLITEEMRNLGQEFLSRFPIYYEFVNGGKRAFDRARKYNPLQVFVYAWNGTKRGVYIRTTAGINHAVENHNTNQIFDTYNPFIKTLASDFIYLDYGVRYIIGTGKEVKKKVMSQEELDKLYKLGLHRLPDNSAKPYLQYNKDFVINEILKSEEWEKINKILNWAKGNSVFNVFSLLELRGVIEKWKKLRGE